MDYNVRVQHYFPAASLQTWATQVLGQAMKKRPTGHYKKYSHFKGRDTAPTTSSRVGSCTVDLSTSGERTLLCSSNPWPARPAHAQFYHVTVRWMTKNVVQRCQSIYVYSLCRHARTHIIITMLVFCRILSLEKLGVVFNQVATPLQYTPRKLVVHPPSANLVIIETDHNTFTEAAKAARKQQIAEVCVCVCDVCVVNVTPPPLSLSLSLSVGDGPDGGGGGTRGSS